MPRKAHESNSPWASSASEGVTTQSWKKVHPFSYEKQETKVGKGQRRTGPFGAPGAKTVRGPTPSLPRVYKSSKPKKSK